MGDEDDSKKPDSNDEKPTASKDDSAQQQKKKKVVEKDPSLYKEITKCKAVLSHEDLLKQEIGAFTSFKAGTYEMSITPQGVFTAKWVSILFINKFCGSF